MIHFDTYIGYALPEDKYEIAELWQEVFHDSYEYIELFFNRVYKPENTLVIKRKGFIISALQMVPYHLKYVGKIYPVAYLCGVCTHPFERGRGYMKHLMRYALNEMTRRGYKIAIVIPSEPSLFEYYRKMGFWNVNYRTIESTFYDKQTILISNLISPYLFETCTSKHFTYFDRKQKERAKTILHDAYDFETILLELASDGGEAFVALEYNTPAGLAFATKTSDTSVFIKDFFAENHKIKKALFSHICHHFNVTNVKAVIPYIFEKKLRPYALTYSLGSVCNIVDNLQLTLMLD